MSFVVVVVVVFVVVVFIVVVVVHSLSLDSGWTVVSPTWDGHPMAIEGLWMLVRWSLDDRRTATTTTTTTTNDDDTNHDGHQTAVGQALDFFSDGYPTAIQRPFQHLIFL